MYLSQIKIVLVATSHSGNIGAAARAMKTMGLDQLVLVSPKDFPSDVADRRSAGAHDVLENARIVDELADAVSDCVRVFGTSVRLREVGWPTLDPLQAAIEIIELLSSETSGTQPDALLENVNQPQVAIVFGRERSGLTNEELALCHKQVCIDSNPQYSSLNLASAVQLIAYEIRKQDQKTQIKKPIPDITTIAVQRQQLATAADQQRHIEHLLVVLQTLDFMRHEHSDSLIRKLKRLYNKAELTVEEVQILRGILTSIQYNL